MLVAFLGADGISAPTYAALLAAAGFSALGQSTWIVSSRTDSDSRFLTAPRIANSIHEVEGGSGTEAALRSSTRESATLKQGSAVFGTTFRRPTASLVEGASACGIGLRRYRKLAVSVDILPKSKLQGRPASIQIRDVRKLSQRLQGSVTLAGAARILGVGRHTIPKLIEAGLLHPLEKPTAGPLGRGH